jgi:hypothetical protein
MRLSVTASFEAASRRLRMRVAVAPLRNDGGCVSRHEDKVMAALGEPVCINRADA